MRHSTKQEGSALMFALLAIVFLTVIGLSLAMVTETEMLIGANEQVAHETFVAAESGVAVGFNSLLINNDGIKSWFASVALSGDQPRTIADRRLGYVIDYTDLYPVLQDIAPFSKANEGEAVDYAYFFIGQARARRLAWPADQAVPDCETESQRLSGAPQTLDYFNNIQAEEELTMGFYVAALPDLTGLTLSEVHEKSDVFGCAPIPPDSDYIQRVN